MSISSTEISIKLSWHDMTFTYSFPFPFLFKKRLIILGLKYLFISYHDYILRKVENPYHIFFLLFMYFDLFYILETKLHFIYTMLPGVRILSDYFFCELTWNFSITTGLSIKASSFLLRMHEKERKQLFIVTCTVNFYPLSIL